MNSVSQRIFGSSLFAWLVLAGFFVYYLHPLRESLRLGIDLVGGTYITLEVQTEKAVEARLVELMHGLKKEGKKAGLEQATAMQIEPVVSQKEGEKRISSYNLILSYANAIAAQNAANYIQSQYKSFQALTSESNVIVSMREIEEKALKREAVDSNIEVIHSRIDKIGVSETPVTRQGERNIVVELPSVSDPQQAKAMIGKAAVLEFKLVEKYGRTEEDLLYEYDGELPTDMEVLPGKSEEGQVSGYYLVPRYTDLTGSLLNDAKGAMSQQDREWVVQFKWNAEGGNKFYDLTSKNHGKTLAVVLDGVVITAPRISTPIRSEGHITGGFTAEGAKELATLLKSGSFAAPITFEEERRVGPSLGAESIRSGLLSCLVGLGLVFLFAIFYYKISGFFAFLALVYNLLITLFCMARIDATLTLPGIAGMVLTIGMAIDASILIYERIKEELKKGLTVKEAVDAGFSDAQWVIIDGNLTTFVVGVVLYNFGTGPVQGFAVTMMIGIFATLVTGLFFLKSIFSFILTNFKLQKLSI